jgi:hypothetical protein
VEASLHKKFIRLLEYWLLRLTVTEKYTGTTDVVQLGQAAVQLLSYEEKDAKFTWRNIALQAAFEKIENDLLHAWKTSTPKDSEAREHVYYRMEGLAAIQLKLKGMIHAMIVEKDKREKEK